MTQVIVLIGAGLIGTAIARRVSAGKHLVVADINVDNIKSVSKTLYDAGFNVSEITVDISSKDSILNLVNFSQQYGEIYGLIHAAGVSPSQAPIETILKVDLYGTALVLEEFGKVMAQGGSGVVISSQSGHRLPALTVDQNMALATTKVEELLALPMLQTEEIKDSLHAYQISKRANGLRVMAEAVHWGKRGARINAISPGIIITPLANDELNGPRGDMYKNMITSSPIGRAGTPDEVGTMGAFLMGAEGAFITGSDFLMDGGVTASYWFGNFSKK